MHDGPVVVFSGGGTGGHLYPALTIADELRKLRPDVRAVFVGAERGLEARILPTLGEEHLLLPVRGIDRAQRLGNWRAVTGLAVGMARAIGLFNRLRPEAVVVTGGYASAAAGIAAGLMGVPLVLQEQNSLPGAVTKLLTRWARQVHLAFPEAQARLPIQPGQVRLTGNPVRDVSRTPRAVARAAYGVPETVSLVLVVGGSQGSIALNVVMIDLAKAVAEGRLSLPREVHFLWATGAKHYDRVCAELPDVATDDWLHAVPYFDDMPKGLAAADLAVSRAGAMATAELHCQGLPAILVPLPTSAEGHQRLNALALADAGTAVVIPQSDLTAELLADRLRELFADEDTLVRMRARALERARPDAKSAIAADVVTLLPPMRST